MKIKILSRIPWVNIISAIRKDIKHMNVGLRPSTLNDLKGIVTTIRSMDTRDMNVDLNPSRHKTSKPRYIIMGILMIGIIIQGTIIIIVVSMVMLF